MRPDVLVARGLADDDGRPARGLALGGMEHAEQPPARGAEMEGAHRRDPQAGTTAVARSCARFSAWLRSCTRESGASS